MDGNSGIKIGLKEGRPCVGESNTVIKEWNNSHIAEANSDIR